MTTQRTELGGPLPAPEFRAVTDAIVTNIEQVIEGKTATVRLALAVMLAEGHLLIEDVPGVGKTKLAKALARSIDCSSGPYQSLGKSRERSEKAIKGLRCHREAVG